MVLIHNVSTQLRHVVSNSVPTKGAEEIIVHKNQKDVFREFQKFGQNTC